MYFFVSFIYFLLLGLNPQSFVSKTPPSDQQLKALNESEMVDINVDGTDLQVFLDQVKNTNPDNPQELDSLLIRSGESEITPWKRHIMKQAVRSMNPKNEDALTKEV